MSSISKEQKLQQFEQMMRDMITSVVEQQTQQSEERIAEAVTEKVSKQMDYLMREKEELQQKQIEILEKILIEMRPAAKEAGSHRRAAAGYNDQIPQERAGGKTQCRMAASAILIHELFLTGYLSALLTTILHLARTPSQVLRLRKSFRVFCLEGHPFY